MRKITLLCLLIIVSLPSNSQTIIDFSKLVTAFTLVPEDGDYTNWINAYGCDAKDHFKEHLLDVGFQYAKMEGETEFWALDYQENGAARIWCLFLPCVVEFQIRNDADYEPLKNEVEKKCEDLGLRKGKLMNGEPFYSKEYLYKKNGTKFRLSKIGQLNYFDVLSTAFIE